MDHVMRGLRIAIWQTGSADLDGLHSRAAEAAAMGARLLITPEAFTTGYNVPGVAAQAQAADGPWLAGIAAIAEETGLAILFGYPEQVGEVVHNSAQLVDRDGRVLANYRKSHLYGELDLRTFTPGEGDFVVADLDDVQVGILICYDVEFPEAVRALALAGADLVAVPTALMRPYEVVTRTVVPARAYENQVYVAYANRSGTEAELTYCGESCVVAPDGDVLARAGFGDELIVADIDLERLAAARVENTHLRDRRPDLYSTLTRAQEKTR
jgi:predicted amidohydrolase